MAKKVHILPETVLKVVSNSWRYDNPKPRNFRGAQKIWLFCHKFKLSIPDDAMEVFAEGVQKDYDSYQAQLPGINEAEIDRRRIRDYVLYRYVNLRMRKYNCSQADALKAYEKILLSKGQEIDFDTRQQYYRMKKILEEYI